MARIESFRPNVLLLEPEVLSRQYVVQALQQLAVNLRVLATLSDADALTHDLHLIILGMDVDPADNLMRIAQARKHCPGAVVMGVCPRMTSSDRCVLLNAGLDFVLEKPFFTEECLSVIKAILRRLSMDGLRKPQAHGLTPIQHTVITRNQKML